MNNIVIRKVKVLQGMAKDIADEYGLEPDDLVILTVSLEKVIGDPVSYLLSQIEDEAEAVLFRCYKCEVNMLQRLDGDWQCPECGDVAKFGIPGIIQKAIDAMEETQSLQGKVNE